MERYYKVKESMYKLLEELYLQSHRNHEEILQNYTLLTYDERIEVLNITLKALKENGYNQDERLLLREASYNEILSRTDLYDLEDYKTERYNCYINLFDIIDDYFRCRLHELSEHLCLSA